MAAVTITGRSPSLSTWAGVDLDLRFSFVFGNSSSDSTTSGGAELNSETTNIDTKERSEFCGGELSSRIWKIWGKSLESI